MSDSDCFCQPKFIFRKIRVVLVVMLGLTLFSCTSDQGAFNYDTYDKRGFTPTRFVPYKQPTYRAGYPTYPNPHSRSYKNPYDFYHPNPYYPSYYDQDYYYVPPSNYRNIEPDYEFGADQKS